MIDPAEYARQREAGRRQSGIAALIFVALMGATVAVRLEGVARGVAVVVLVLLLAVFAVLGFRIPEPRTLTPLAHGVNDGSWPASAPIFQFQPGGGAAPHARRGEVLGRVAVDARGVTFTPSRNSARVAHTGAVTWDVSWTAAARRLPGLGSLMQLSVTKEGEPPMTLWLFRAKKLWI